jgi:hypothetical protein
MQGVVLQRSGHNVHIFERSPTIPEGRGAGLSIRPMVRKFLSTWDRPQKPYYIDVGVVSFLDREGRETKQWAMPLKSTSWASLYYRLRANFDGLQSDHYPESLINELEHFPTTSSQVQYELGRTVTDIRSEGGKVMIEHESTVDAKDKTLASADLVIVADGSNSRTRRILQPEANPTFAGYVAWRGLVPEELVSADLREFFGNKFSYFSVKGVGHIILCVFTSIIFVSLCHDKCHSSLSKIVSLSFVKQVLHSRRSRIPESGRKISQLGVVLQLPSKLCLIPRCYDRYGWAVSPQFLTGRQGTTLAMGTAKSSLTQTIANQDC